MPNSDTSAAFSFHDATKLSYISLATKPSLYKSYPGLPIVALPPEMPSQETPTLPAVSGGVSPLQGPLDLASVAQLLHYSAGLIRRSTLRTAGEVHYRAAASAGALYPIELYLVCGNIEGLDAGVYHYAPATNSLSLLRSGDFRGNLAASAGHGGIANAPTTIVCSGVFWRSAWKYRERGYRYCFWDNGTILANMTATATALGQPAEVVAGFVDSEIDTILGLDSEKEATFCLIPVGVGDDAPPAVGHLSPVDAGVLGVERRTEYPETRALHSNSCLGNAAEVLAWREGGSPPPNPANGAGWPASAPLGATIAHRGSTRRFAREPMTEGRLEALLSASTTQINADFGGGLIDTYMIVNAAEGIGPGAYYYSPGNGGGLELLQEGEFREEAGHLCFEQALGADASAVAFLMADLNAILSRLGNRGYRTAQLEAGIIGGRMYLCSHAMGLGATGMTFFDDAVTAFFSPHATGKSLMFLVGLGVTHSRNRVHPFRSRIGMLKDSLARGAAGQSQPVPDWLYA